MIGIFDSGTGGLSIYLALKKLHPEVSCTYFADHIHFPYGEKTVDEIISYSRHISRFLYDLQARVIVIACNTATIAAIEQLRKEFPIPFIGTVPAVKPASIASKTKKIAVLLTRTASQGDVFQELVTSWSDGVEVYTIKAPELVEISENQSQQLDQSEQYLRSILDPLMKAQVDSLVLGSTHFIFLKDWISSLYPGQFRIFDPAEGVARQTFRVLETVLNNNEESTDVFYTSGLQEVFQHKIHCLLPIEFHRFPVMHYHLP